MVRAVKPKRYKRPVRDAILELLVGDQIGDGAHRRVYEMPGRPDLVMKVERLEGEFANVKEWLAWDELQWDLNAKLWLAPCLEISRSGLVLLQRRCPDLTDAQWGTFEHCPGWLGDLKRDNWGWFEPHGEEDGPARPVMRDYALNRLAFVGSSTRRTVEKGVR